RTACGPAFSTNGHRPVALDCHSPAAKSASQNDARPALTVHGGTKAVTRYPAVGGPDDLPPCSAVSQITQKWKVVPDTCSVFQAEHLAAAPRSWSSGTKSVG